MERHIPSLHDREPDNSQAGGQGGAIAKGVIETEPKADGGYIMANKCPRGN